MNGHPEYLELIAASIDFDLTDEEFGRLSTHLVRCPDCRRAADELRGQASIIAAQPVPRLGPARSEQILRAALRTPPARPRWGMLAVAAMLATLGGGLLFAGYQLVDEDDTAPSEPPPSLIAEASVPPSAEPTDEPPGPGGPEPVNGPRVTPNPGDEEPSPPDLGVVDFEFPLPFDTELGPVRVAPAPNDRLWVSISGNDETVLALLDDVGEGSPWVEPNVTGCEPLAVGDGSVRAICSFSDLAEPETCVDVCAEPRVYGWWAPGNELPGFPVTLPTGISTATSAARMVGTDLVTVTTESYDEVVAEFGDHGSARITTVGADGTIREGAQVPAPASCCTISPDGVAYGATPADGDGPEIRTQVVAFDQRGMRPGWPVTLEGGAASNPSFGPNRQVVLLSMSDEGTRIVRLSADGSEAAPTIDLPFHTDSDDSGPRAPLVDQGGRTWVVANGAIHGFDPQGNPLPGFPYEPDTRFAEQSRICDTGTDTSCHIVIKPPRVAPQSIIYTLENAPEGKGGVLNVVNRDGSIRSGWPKTLQRPGAAWDSVTIGENRRAYAVAVEPEPGGKSSVSILAFAPNGTREWITTVVEP